MEEMEVIEVPEVLGLRVLSSRIAVTGRKLVPDDPRLAELVSADGQALDAGAWQVSLSSCFTAGTGLRQLVTIEYRDPQAKPGTKPDRQQIVFNTGRLELSCLDAEQVDGKLITSRIQLNYEEYKDVLAKIFDIRSGYRFETPNHTWTSSDEHPTKLATDGVVIPTPSGLNVIDATWTVACCYSISDPHKASITLYTEEEELDGLMQTIESYLEEHDMSGFGDLLPQ